MTLSICRTRSTNVCSLGSRFDHFVVQHSHSPADHNVAVLPKILARVYDPELAFIAARHYRDRNTTLGNDNTTVAVYGYHELQTMLARFDNRILSFPDVFYDESLNCD
jgi:hypothetical protein